MFLVSLLCGGALEIVWECLGFIGFAVRYKRKGGSGRTADSPFGLIIIFIKDILFFTLAGAVFSVLIYWANDGQFRFLALVGVIIGFIICHRTLGRLIRLLNEQIVKLLFTLLSILFYPARKLIGIAVALIRRAAEAECRRRMRCYTMREIRAVDVIKLRGMPR